MKVKFVDFEEGIIAFASKLIGTMPTTSHKFISGLVLTSLSGRLETALGALADAEGLVDTDEVRKFVSGGFKAAGDRVSFQVGEDSMKWLFKPVVVSVTRNDVMNEISAIESRCAK